MTTFGQFNVDYEQRAYNPERMRNYRIDRAQAMLKKYGLGALVTFDYDTFRYFGYYSTHQYARRRLGYFMLLVKDQGYPYTAVDPDPPTWEEELMPWFKGKMVLEWAKQFMLTQGWPQKPEFKEEHWKAAAAEVKALLVKHKVQDMPVGIDMLNIPLYNQFSKAGIKLVDGNPCIAAMRMIKNEDEINCLRMAGVIAESAHWEVCQALRPGITEFQIAGIAANACFKLGAEELEGPSFVVCSGNRSGHSVPNMPTDRIVRPGDFVVLDINGVGFQGYRTCFYRTYCVGDRPTEFQKDIYNAAYEGLIALSSVIKPGITNLEAQKRWNELGKEKNRWGNMPTWPNPGRYFFGSAGHHIGLASPDPIPGIPATAMFLGPEGSPPFTIEENMTFANEVGCFQWDGSKWAYDGVKLEYCGVVRKTGFEVFYKFPLKDLLVCGLPALYPGQY